MVAQSRVHGYRGSKVIATLALAAFGLLGGTIAGLGASLAGYMASVMTPFLAIGLAMLIAIFSQRRQPWQFDRETPWSWLEYGDWRTSLLNGVALGLGFTTRIRYWSYLVILLTAFSSGDLLFGVFVGAAYGFTRLSLSTISFVRQLSTKHRKSFTSISRSIDNMGLAVGLSVVAAMASRQFIQI